MQFSVGEIMKSRQTPDAISNQRLKIVNFNV